MFPQSHIVILWVWAFIYRELNVESKTSLLLANPILFHCILYMSYVNIGWLSLCIPPWFMLYKFMHMLPINFCRSMLYEYAYIYCLAVPLVYACYDMFSTFSTGFICILSCRLCAILLCYDTLNMLPYIVHFPYGSMNMLSMSSLFFLLSMFTCLWLSPLLCIQFSLCYPSFRPIHISLWSHMWFGSWDLTYFVLMMWL